MAGNTRDAVNNDTVVHPTYYNAGEPAFEAWNYIKAHDLDFDLGNVIKYVTRAGKKDNASKLKDLKKAKQYLQHAIDHET